MSGAAPRKTPGYETRDVRPRALLGFAAGLLAVLAAAFLVCAWLGRVLLPPAASPEAPRSPLEDARARPPGPVLQTDPAGDLARERARMQEEIESYGWVDRSRGVVRIPVERAMELLLEEGFPAAAEEDR